MRFEKWAGSTCRRVVFVVLFTVLGQPIALPAIAAGTLDLTVDCTGDPEVIAIVNRSDESVTIETIGSFLHPRPQEPFVRNDRLTPGGSAIYGLGRGSPGIQLDGNLIFDDLPGEGVRVRTNFGFLEVACAAGRGSLPIVRPAPRPPRTLLPVPAGPADGAVPNGWFYTQAAGLPDRGFAVTDDAVAGFWTEFRRLGGVEGVGYPISRRFLWDGFPTQAFQKMVLQWRAGEGRAEIVNVVDLLHDRGLDDWLLTVRSTPRMADWSVDAGRPWSEIVEIHQALLTDPDIRAAYFAPPDPIAVYGLPMAPIQRIGDALVLRAQRGIIQKWLIDVPWARAGEVTIANSGDLAKEAGLLPAAALTPESP